MALFKRIFDYLENYYEKPTVLIASIVITLIELIGFILIFIFSLSTEEWAKIFTTLSMIAGASIGIGVLIGFLFGIPKTIQNVPLNTKEGVSDNASNSNQKGYSVNTNLEQVSDWLTKIMVGVGLTQFREMKAFMDELLTGFVKSLPGLESAKPLMTATILLYIFLGFFGGYMLTRLYLSEKFYQADEEIGKRNPENV